MRILVTGGTGLVGRALQDVVHSLDCKDEWLFLGSKDYNLLVASEVENMYKVEKPDVVVHLAARVGGLFKNMRDNVAMFEDNILMGISVISCAHKFGVKKLICMCSTCVFPDKVEYPISEHALHNGPPHHSNEGYAYAKRILEIHCRLYTQYHGREYICLIPTNIYGPYDNFNLNDGHVLPSLIHKCHLARMNNSRLVVYGSGRPVRQFIYSIDLARIIISCVRTTPSKSPIICCPDASDEISIKDLAYLVASSFGIDNTMVVFDETFADGQQQKTCSNDVLRSNWPDFEFTPLQDGMKSTVDWFSTNIDSCRK